MKFLVYVVVLTVSVSTILLELHWLTSPPPHPKPAIHAAVAPAARAKPDGPNRELSPVYPTLAGAPRTVEAATGATQPAAGAGDAPPRPTVAATAGPAAAETAGVATQDRLQARKPAAETTGMAAPVTEKLKPSASDAEPVTTAAVANSRAGAEANASEVKPLEAKPLEAKLLEAKPPATPAASARLCNVSACASVYRSFRESDCSYQPYGGARQVCDKPPAETRRVARDAAESSPRRLSRDAGRRDVERAVRHLTERNTADAYTDDEPVREIVVRRPRWHWRW